MSDAVKPSFREYWPYFNVTDDGFLWWPLKDAIRLAAGYQLYVDDDQALEPELRATSKRVLANERTLIGAFGDARLSIAKPITFERDGFRYVDAAGFLTWLSQYISLKQPKIEFPDALADEVRIALAKAAAERPHKTTSGPFESLTLALEPWFEQALVELPDALRYRVDREILVPWDSLAPAQRRAAALQRDYRHDPAMEQDRRSWWEFLVRKRTVRAQIATWEATATPAANDLALKEGRLKEMREELARMDERQRQASGSYSPARKPSAAANEAPAMGADYIAYPKAMAMLAGQLDATPEELAAWVWMGPKDSGIAAYLNANELDPPPRFHYDLGNGDDFDYVSPLMACWFNAEDIAQFEPTDRYITGQTLIERWSRQPGLQAEAFIRAKIAESRLLDAHPIFGSTQGTCPEQSGFPPLASGLFLLAHVEAIEAEDFANVEEGKSRKGQSTVPPAAPKSKGHLNHDLQMQERANQIAAQKMEETKRPVTRDKVAKLLAAELGMTIDTVLRRIRKQW
ncbi:hypothetical protein [Sulfuritalea sp.]|uniref:hypothetical protein n=1 Tax=Sulfuritalea sp. TaxID=2480090 RepID=UPI001ACFAC89|nr:hypothetical protein [Sulfuritalea sp.]MBN8476057.1 hypothetical protein [Sulfuritalea sp.]